MEIKKIRKKLGVTQKDFSLRIGVSLFTVRNWEQGLTNPNEKNKKKIKELMNG